MSDAAEIGSVQYSFKLPSDAQKAEPSEDWPPSPPYLPSIWHNITCVFDLERNDETKRNKMQQTTPSETKRNETSILLLRKLRIAQRN
eukprot:scaffold221841_cov14-Prasinocladus_malaysianus.AAC.1